MYISYQPSPSGLYAKIAKSVRKGKKVGHEYTNLGYVVDMERQIFKNRERGLFHYDLATNTYSPVPDDFIEPERTLKPHPKRNPLIVNFGSTYVLDMLCSRYGIKKMVDAIPISDKESFMALLYYYIENEAAGCYANDWFEGDFVRLLFPKANLESSAVSRLLREAGDEYVKRDFFKAYFERFPSLMGSDGQILIDSSGLPNAIHFPYTAPCVRNGDYGEDVKLIYAAKVGSQLPVYYQYDASNVLDRSMLANALLHMKGYGIDIGKIIFDAGYSGNENFSECFGLGIDFLTRLGKNLLLAKESIEEASQDLEDASNAVRYGNRLLQVRKVPRIIDGHNVFIYVILDWKEQQLQSDIFNKSKDAESMDASELLEKRQELGRTVLLCSRDLAVEEVVPYYCKRQEMEQLFDVSRNYTGMLLLAEQYEETFRGHLLLTFIAAIVISLIRQLLMGLPLPDESIVPKLGRKSVYKEPEFNCNGMFRRLDNQKCNIYTTRLVPAVPYRAASEVYSFFKIKPPKYLSLKTRNKLTYVVLDEEAILLQN